MCDLWWWPNCLELQSKHDNWEPCNLNIAHQTHCRSTLDADVQICIRMLNVHGIALASQCGHSLGQCWRSHANRTGDKSQPSTAAHVRSLVLPTFGTDADAESVFSKSSTGHRSSMRATDGRRVLHKTSMCITDLLCLVVLVVISRADGHTIFCCLGSVHITLMVPNGGQG